MCIYSGLCCYECGVNEMGCYKKGQISVDVHICFEYLP